MASDSPLLDLKDACVTAAHAVIAEQGVEKLSLRDVARKLNVSHQAPYKHYANRDRLLSEVIRRCFVRFSQALNARTRSADTKQDVHALGISYLQFAVQHPLEYRLMFNTPWPAQAAQPDMLAEARYSFELLRQALQPLFVHHPDATLATDTAAMFMWSTLHGLASILQSQALCGLKLHPHFAESAQEQVMALVNLALDAAQRQQPE
jgi:AcrR family transcriptional regulator